MRQLCAALLAVLFPSIAAAQNSGIYIQAGPLLDTLFTSGADGIPVDGGLIGSTVTGSNVTWQWNDINGDRRWQSGEEVATVLPGLSPIQTRESPARFAPGASVAVGVFVTPSISLRLEASFQGERATTTESTPLRLFAPTESRHAVSSTDIFVSAGWHQGESRRVTITYLGGMVFRRQREETTLTFNYSVIRTIIGLPTPTVTPQTEEQTFGFTAYSAGVMAGLDVAFNLSQRVAIVPQVRMVTANHDLSVRPAVVMRWRP